MVGDQCSSARSKQEVPLGVQLLNDGRMDGWMDGWLHGFSWLAIASKEKESGFGK